ncbi:MAG: hypothetical protein QM662_17040 [Gordonia sp. (in: high G+C Gram-positive bacteria)]
MSTATNRKDAARAFRAIVAAHTADRGGIIMSRQMTPDELQRHLADRGRGGRRQNRRAARKAGQGKGGRSGARRAACAD